MASSVFATNRREQCDGLVGTQVRIATERSGSSLCIEMGECAWQDEAEWVSHGVYASFIGMYGC